MMSQYRRMPILVARLYFLFFERRSMSYHVSYFCTRTDTPTATPPLPSVEITHAAPAT